MRYQYPIYAIYNLKNILVVNRIFIRNEKKILQKYTSLVRTCASLFPMVLTIYNVSFLLLYHREIILSNCRKSVCG